MILEDVYQYFGSAGKAAKAVGYTRAAFSRWVKIGYIPYLSQVLIEQVTKGALKADKNDAEFKTPKKDLDTFHLPQFRYYSSQNGMCFVEFIFFRKNLRPKIVYKRKDNKLEKFTAFGSENLMQALGVLDSEGQMIFEGDILLKRSGDIYNVRNVDFNCKKLSDFKIIGNIYEGKKDGYKKRK